MTGQWKTLLSCAIGFMKAVKPRGKSLCKGQIGRWIASNQSSCAEARLVAPSAMLQAHACAEIDSGKPLGTIELLP